MKKMLSLLLAAVLLLAGCGAAPAETTVPADSAVPDITMSTDIAHIDSEGDGTFAVFRFSSVQQGGRSYLLKNEAGDTVAECVPETEFTVLVISGEGLAPGIYTLWQDGKQLSGSAGEMGGVMGMPGFPGGVTGNVGTPGNVPGAFDGQPPEGDFQIPQQPGGQLSPQGGTDPGDQTGEVGTDFEIKAGGNYFGNVGESLLSVMPIQ